MTSQSYSHSWPAPLANAPLRATIELPASKSLNNRELILSAIADSPSNILNPLVSRDSELMIGALRQLGVKIVDQPEGLEITPGNLKGPALIDCGLAGTVMRFVPPLAALATGAIDFDGDEAAKARPMKTTIDSLRSLGVEVAGDGLPFRISGSGKVLGGELEIDASKSSQFVSGLLLVAARFENGLTLRHTGSALPSMPHIEMTIDCLVRRGVKAKALSSTSWRVEAGTIQGREVTIEPDLSNAGPFLAAAMVAGGSVTIKNWPWKTTQVGDEFRQLLGQMGAKFHQSDSHLTIVGDGSISGITVDLSRAGELTPVIAALATIADSPTIISGISHLRGHETDRLKALATEINRIGGDAKETQDGLEINPRKLHGGIWQSYQDHRMATAGAIIGLRVEGIEIDDISTTSKTMPDFPALWKQMLGERF